MSSSHIFLTQCVGDVVRQGNLQERTVSNINHLISFSVAFSSWSHCKQDARLREGLYLIHDMLPVQ